MENSILISTKKTLGIAADYTAFDLDIITFINGAFSTLTQLGVGPTGGFAIDDDTAVWSDFIPNDPITNVPDAQYNSVKTYVHLRVRILFDPPTTAYLTDALNKQIEEFEWRLNVHREEDGWVDPDPEPVLPSRDPNDGWEGGLIFYG